MAHLLVEGAPLFVGLLLLIMACTVRLWCLQRSIGQAIYGFAVCLVPCLGGSSEVDPLKPRVRAECERRRVERARAIVVVASLICIYRFAELANDVRRGREVDGAKFMYFIAFVSALATACPALVTRRTIDAGYVLAMLGLSGSVVLEDKYWTPSKVEMNGIWFIGFGLSIIALRPWLNALCLAVVAACAVTERALLGQAAYMGTARNYLLVVFFLCFLDWSFRTSVHLELQAKDSGNQLRAVQALLDSICDVIVEVGAGLRLRRHSVKLADILLQGPLKSLEGAALQDFMPDEKDREAFEQNLSGCHDSESRGASVFHTTLRDSMGSKVAMEFFAVAFKSPDGHRGHLLGMREYTDTQPMRPLAILPLGARQQPPPVEFVQRGTPASRERSDLPLRGDARSSAGSSEGDAGSESSRSSASAQHAVKAEQPIRNTASVVKRASMAKMLESWKVEPTCCEWHAALCEAQEIAQSLVTVPCSPSVPAKERGWQCQRCGIISKRWRLGRSAEHCTLCETFSEDMLAQESSSRLWHASL